MKNNYSNSKKSMNYGKKQMVHSDKTGYDKLNHKKSDARSSGVSYENLQKMVKKL